MGREKAYTKAGRGREFWLFGRDGGAGGWQWFVGEDIWSDGVLAYIDTWSADPCRAAAGTSKWRVSQEGQWFVDDFFALECHGLDEGGVDACGGLSPCVNLVAATATGAPAVEMPLVMLGTAYISEKHGSGATNPATVESPPAIAEALDLGYQGLDIGSQMHPAYANEALVGQLLEDRPGRRRSVFITTKLSPNEHGFNATLRAAQRSLKLLQTDTIDLYLIHHPSCLMAETCEGGWGDSWRAMERLLGLGAVRSIGVCNFDEQLLDHLVNTVARAPVALLQSRSDPLAQEGVGVLKFCQEHHIQYQAFSSLGRQWVVTPAAAYWGRMNPILASRAVLAISARCAVSPAQVALRWAIEKGWAVIP